jgi:leucyl/phenylalanyl-tRNA--protein transferase
VSFDYIFPDPESADKEGLVAVGGDLSEKALITAYSNGIFPWYSEGSVILWWSPDPRMILFPHKFRISHSLSQKIKQHKFEIEIDKNFESVIHHCAIAKRKKQSGTWITPEMQQAYTKLHLNGYAHSVETYYHGHLVGGLYGVSLGRAFFGESMFYLMPDASKLALYYLTEQLKKWNFHFIDAQQSTTHLKNLGAEDVPRKKFLKLLKNSLQYPTKQGKWKFDIF